MLAKPLAEWGALEAKWRKSEWRVWSTVSATADRLSKMRTVSWPLASGPLVMVTFGKSRCSSVVRHKAKPKWVEKGTGRKEFYVFCSKGAVAKRWIKGRFFFFKGTIAMHGCCYESVESKNLIRERRKLLQRGGLVKKRSDCLSWRAQQFGHGSRWEGRWRQYTCRCSWGAGMVGVWKVLFWLLVFLRQLCFSHGSWTLSPWLLLAS